MMAQIDLIQVSSHMAKEEKVKKKVKKPTALKRDITAKKRNLKNRVYKSRVKTAIRAYEEVVAKGDKDASAKSLNEIYSLVDKGVKTGVFKKNKSSRVKARMAGRLAA